MAVNKKHGNAGVVSFAIRPASAGGQQRHGISIRQSKESGVIGGTIHALSHREIDRRIECLTRDVATTAADETAGAASPRWISAAELVDRLRPFLVYN